MKFINARKYLLAEEISTKYLGRNKLLQNAVIGDIEQIRSLVAELKSEYSKLNEETSALTSSVAS